MKNQLKKDEYFQLRNELYNAVGELGTLAEKYEYDLFNAYDSGCNMLDYIDDLGYKLKYLDPETNEEL